MTDKPKTFTTEIEWFNPSSRMPDEEKLIFIFSPILKKSWNTNDAGIFIGTMEDNQFIFSGDVEDKEICLGLEHIKYWAYLPTLPEI